MQHRHRIAEMSSHDPQKLRGQGDFGYQQHGTLAVIQTGADQFDINRRFARAGHTVQQCRTGCCFLPLGIETLKDRLLCFIQHQRAIQSGRFDFSAPQNRPLR